MNVIGILKFIVILVSLTVNFHLATILTCFLCHTYWCLNCAEDCAITQNLLRSLNKCKCMEDLEKIASTQRVQPRLLLLLLPVRNYLPVCVQRVLQRSLQSDQLRPDKSGKLPPAWIGLHIGLPCLQSLHRKFGIQIRNYKIFTLWNWIEDG